MSVKNRIIKHEEYGEGYYFECGKLTSIKSTELKEIEVNNQYNCGNFCGSIKDFLATYNEAAKGLINPCLEIDADVEHGYYDDYSASVVFTVIGTRKPTKEELDLFHRLQDEYKRQYLQDRKDQREFKKQQEFETYQKLKAKFEKDSQKALAKKAKKYQIMHNEDK